jgi:hypothetical protein
MAWPETPDRPREGMSFERSIGITRAGR